MVGSSFQKDSIVSDYLHILFSIRLATHWNKIDALLYHWLSWAILQDNPLKSPYATLTLSTCSRSVVFVKHLQEVKHFLVSFVACKVFHGVLVVVGNRVDVDTMTSHTSSDTDFASIFHRIKQPIFGNILLSLRHWLVLLTEMLAAFEWERWHKRRKDGCMRYRIIWNDGGGDVGRKVVCRWQRWWRRRR